MVRFRRPDATSAFASNTNALFAAPAPFVMPSNFSRSVSFMSAEPIINELPEVILPVVLIVPSTSKPSLMFTVDESSALIVVPLNLSAEAITPPVPPGAKIKSALELV